MSSRAARFKTPSLVTMSTYVAVFALVLAYVALVAAYAALRTLARLRQATALLSRDARGAKGKQSLIEATQLQAESTAALAEQVQQLRDHVDRSNADLLRTVEKAVAARDSEIAGVLRNVALVRYDAFTDMSGRMSFSLAVLDERGDGVVLSAIAAHTDTRVYAKGVTAGAGEHELSPEERQAVEASLHKRRAGLLGRKAG